jgi:hypothetical protein
MSRSSRSPGPQDYYVTQTRSAYARITDDESRAERLRLELSIYHRAPTVRCGDYHRASVALKSKRGLRLHWIYSVSICLCNLAILKGVYTFLGWMDEQGS